ncbi:hypothetical protein ACFOEZ_01800 [Tianweitania populi]|uniref:DUF3060 domain-containing protein n=1 Tax=Tianweitania populi TaxID=1607949 RepID=A0A8J3GK52_9HYPH|nr:hypothetical protein [Tianweitania populi]GHD05563.1 hypothetical protein GCM10016234_01760 [Tianweitania populi]
MMVRLIVAGALAAGMFSTAAGVAQAQPSTCGCAVSGAQSAALGTIQSSEGRVVIVGAKGPRQAAAGQSISAADRVATSVQSTAVVVAGGCQVSLAGEQELRFERQGENLCVAVNDTGAVNTTGQVRNNNNGAVPGAAGGAGVASYAVPAAAAVLIGGAAIATATSDSDNRVSQ